ncbi:MAG: hypothetical protein RLZZ403_845 [Pseudomonadota bacterium]|jgi:hypothetical protein
MKAMCVGGPLDGQLVTVKDGLRIFHYEDTSGYRHEYQVKVVTHDAVTSVMAVWRFPEGITDSTPWGPASTSLIVGQLELDRAVDKGGMLAHVRENAMIDAYRTAGSPNQCMFTITETVVVDQFTDELGALRVEAVCWPVQSGESTAVSGAT